MRRRFADAFQSCLDRIPRGKVATCGTVARALGDVRAARTVAEWLRDHPSVVGGHRIVRADGRPILAAAVPLVREEGATDSDGRAAPDRFLDGLPEEPLLKELREEQQRLAQRIQERDEDRPVQRLGGADVAYAGDRAFAVAVNLDAESLEVTQIVVRETEVDFPYIPSYLAFREFPAIESAVHRLSERPDVLFVDGHGRLHPILFGFACYVGARLDLPTIGIAKHPLAGRPVPSARGPKDVTPIELEGSIRGYAWRPPQTSRPIYVSVGHRISLEGALALTQRATRERYPEPLRIADRISKEERKKNAERSASDRTAVARSPAHGSEGL